jgi:hypothetical protein
VIFLIYGKVRNLEREKEKGGSSLGCICSASVFLTTYLRTLTGARVAGNFGLGGQETVRNPGAREPERLFLAGWEVNQFGQDSSTSVQLQFNIRLSFSSTSD